jgi:DNA repair protein RadC
MNKAPALPGFERLVEPFKFPARPYQYKVQALRECPTPDALYCCDTPEKAAEYWRLNIPTDPYFNPEVECFVVLMLDIRLRLKGHYLVSVGTQDTTFVHPREVFRVAVVASAHSIILAHNHPSGNPTPSPEDIKSTRRLVRAGEILDIPVVEHVVIGNPGFASLYKLGHISK